MLSHLDLHDLSISSCGVPLRDELLHICLSDPAPPRQDRALIWLAMLHGLDELLPVLASAPAPLALNPDQAVGFYVALHLAGNPTLAAPVLLQLVADAGEEAAEAATATPLQVMNRLVDLAEESPWAELIRQASLLHLSDPADLLKEWLGQLERSITERMPFAALLQLSILCRSPEKLPGDWQTQLAEAITALGDLPDAIPLYRFWMVVCQLAPVWDFARIRAADLALRFEDFAIADHLLERIELTAIQNVWLYDVKARCRCAYGDLYAAARLWSLALMKTDVAAPEHHVFRDRLLAALRGKLGLAEACRMARSGQFAEAVQLLQTLILYDPTFPSYYRLLLSLKERLAREGGPPINQLEHRSAQVEAVIEEFRSLWLDMEHSDFPAVEPVHLDADIQRAALFLGDIEKSIWLTDTSQS